MANTITFECMQALLEKKKREYKKARKKLDKKLKKLTGGK